MNKLRIPTMFLAAALQVMPLLRNALPLQTEGLAPSAWAIVFKLAAGGVALFGYHAVSSASVPVTLTSATSVTGYVGVPFFYKATFSGLGTDPGAIFATTNSPVPAGLTFTTYDVPPYGSANVYGILSGKPTNQLSNVYFNINAGHPSGTPVITNIFLTVLPAPVPLPASNNIAAGDIATFTITAGPLPLTYRWRLNGTNIVGATNASYTLTNAPPAAAGNYSVVITNSAGSFTSAVAVLTINAGTAPSITAAPANLTVTAGQPAAFNVAATGTTPLSYQWRRSGTPIPGANGTNYTLTPARLSDSTAAFTVVITNIAGSITSSPAAILTVNSPPPPVAGPALLQGGNFLFTFTPVVGLTNRVLTNAAAETPPASWGVLTNVPPPGSTSSITVTDSVAGPARFYRVQVVP